MFSGIKKNATDTYFSNIVRKRANYICERCLRDFKERLDIFDCSHFNSRANHRVRWDFENVLALCRGCHDYFSKNPGDHTFFIQKKLGLKAFNNLLVRSERKLTDQKIDEKLIRQGLRLEWNRMKKEEKDQIFGAR